MFIIFNGHKNSTDTASHFYITKTGDTGTFKQTFKLVK